MNHLDRAKGRLAALLSPAQRAELALMTLTTVWEAALEATAGVAILTADPRVRVLLGPSADVIEESAEAHGLNGQLTAAVARLSSDGTLRGGPLLILHADLPLATVESIREFVAYSPGPNSATLVRSGDGGTNAMLLWPADGMELAYGSGSAAKHEANALAAGRRVAWCESAGLTLDLDMPVDLAALLARPGGADTLAGKALTAMDVVGKLGATE
ncbi:MAG: 2-phospho-L-lactate guanylyltransferase [Tepidiformaceae bacterium]